MNTQAQWYLENRIEYLRNRLRKLRDMLAPAQNGDFDYDILKEFFEVRGRLKELENVLEHMGDW